MPRWVARHGRIIFTMRWSLSRGFVSCRECKRMDQQPSASRHVIVVKGYLGFKQIFKYAVAEAYRCVNVLVSLLANSQHGIMDLKILIWYIRGHQPLSTKVLVVQRLIQEEHVQMLRFPPAKPKTTIWWTTHEHMCQHHHCFEFASSPVASKTSISTDNWACWIRYCQHACVFMTKICWSLPQANESDSGYNALRPLGEDFEDLWKIKVWILIVLKICDRRVLATILLSSKKARTGNGCKLIPWNCLHQSVFLAPKWFALFLPVRLAVGFLLNTFAHSPFRLAWTRTYDAWCLFCIRMNANQPIIRQAPELKVLTRWATLWKVDNLHGSSLLRDHGTRRNSLNPRFFFTFFQPPLWLRRIRHFGSPGLDFSDKNLVRLGRRRWDMHLLDTSFLSRSMTFWWRRVWI